MRFAFALLASAPFLFGSVTAAPVGSVLATTSVSTAFIHPGMLSTQAQLTAAAAHVAAKESPWHEGYTNLVNSRYCLADSVPHPVVELCRGAGWTCTENYGLLYRDAATAYQNALRWKMEGNTSFADGAVNILNAWSSTMKTINGASDRYLASGIYGYQLANAAELVRDYEGFSAENLTSVINLLTGPFYFTANQFLTYHNWQKIDHYWANWDLCNMATVMAAGILSDNRTMYNEAIDYFYNGAGEGAIDNLVRNVYADGTGQIEEAGRDQGHATLDISLIAVIAQMAYSQGDDLYAYQNNRILAGVEYEAKYNLGYNVSYTPFNTSLAQQPALSNASRGIMRPTWDIVRYHYASKGIETPYTTQMAEVVRNFTRGADAGAGYYGGNSGGFDQLGFTTLLYAT